VQDDVLACIALIRAAHSIWLSRVAKSLHSASQDLKNTGSYRHKHKHTTASLLKNRPCKRLPPSEFQGEIAPLQVFGIRHAK